MSHANLGLFLFETARGTESTRTMPEKLARKVQQDLSEQISNKIDQIRTEQRKAVEESLAITLF